MQWKKNNEIRRLYNIIRPVKPSTFLQLLYYESIYINIRKTFESEDEVVGFLMSN